MGLDVSEGEILSDSLVNRSRVHANHMPLNPAMPSSERVKRVPGVKRRYAWA